MLSPLRSSPPSDGGLQLSSRRTPAGFPPAAFNFVGAGVGLAVPEAGFCWVDTTRSEKSLTAEGGGKGVGDGDRSNGPWGQAGGQYKEADGLYKIDIPTAPLRSRTCWCRMTGGRRGGSGVRGWGAGSQGMRGHGCPDGEIRELGSRARVAEEHGRHGHGGEGSREPLAGDWRRPVLRWRVKYSFKASPPPPHPGPHGLPQRDCTTPTKPTCPISRLLGCGWAR